METIQTMSKEPDNWELKKFSIYFLLYSNLISRKAGNVCMFAGINGINDIIDLFKQKRENELFKIPFCTKKIISELRKLCREFKDPVINKKFFFCFEQKYINAIKLSEKNSTYSISSSEINEKFNKAKAKNMNDFIKNADISFLQTYTINAFIKDYDLGIRSANILKRITTGNDSIYALLRAIAKFNYDFLLIKDCGRKSQSEIWEALHEFMKKINMLRNESNAVQNS